jgi:hypothetical protein
MTQPGEDLHELDSPELDTTPARLPADLRLTSEVNEADAYEQSQVVELDDDYR